MSHAKSYFFMFSAIILLAACDASPVEETKATPANGAGGKAGGGGSGGSGGQAATGGGGAGGGMGGSGGSVPSFVFDCSDVAASRLVMKVRAKYEPQNYTAADGSIVCPSNGGCSSTGWVALFMGKSKEKESVMDLGEFPPGTTLETNWGTSPDGTIKTGSPNYQPKPVPESGSDVDEHAVLNGTTYCFQNVCSYAEFKCCYGTNELLIANVSGVNTQNGANLVCVTQ